MSGSSSSSPSVLIIRLDGAGDALALTPLLAELRRRAIPAAVVLSERNRGIFARSALSAAYVAPFGQRDETRANHLRIRAFADTLRGAYTHALIATEDPAGYRLAKDAAIPQRIGFQTGLGKPFKNLWIRSTCTRTLYRSPVVDSSGLHECEILFELGRALYGPHPEPERRASRLRGLIVDAPAPPDERIAVQITDKWERLGARFEELVALVRGLRAAHPLRFLAATSERTYADRVAAACGIHIDYFEDIPPWKTAIASARALVAPDGGAIHVAGMTGVRTLAVFAAGPQFLNQTVRWRPWAAPHRLLALEGAWPLVAADSLGGLLGRSP